MTQRSTVRVLLVEDLRGTIERRNVWREEIEDQAKDGSVYIEAVDGEAQKTDLLYVSPQIEAMFGYSPEE